MPFISKLSNDFPFESQLQSHSATEGSKLGETEVINNSDEYKLLWKN